MGDFFAKISNQFTAPLLLSASFPVVLFLIAFTLVVLPLTPYGHDLTAAVQDPKYWQDHASVALVLTLIVLMLSVLLYNLNTPIIRIYEAIPGRTPASPSHFSGAAITTTTRSARYETASISCTARRNLSRWPSMSTICRACNPDSRGS